MSGPLPAQGVQLSFALFRRLFPLSDLDPKEPPLTDQERRTFRRWELAGLIPLFIFAPSLGFCWYLLLKTGAGLIDHKTPDTIFLIQSTPMFWGVLACLPGIITAAVPMHLLYQTLLGARYRRYLRACDERYGYNGMRALRPLSLLVLIGSALAFVAGVTSFTRFTWAGVETRMPLSPRSTFHEHKSIRAIEHRATFQAPNGNMLQRPHYVVLFDDDTSWSSQGFLREPDSKRDDRVIQWLSQRSGRPIIERP